MIRLIISTWCYAKRLTVLWCFRLLAMKANRWGNPVVGGKAMLSKVDLICQPFRNKKPAGCSWCLVGRSPKAMGRLRTRSQAMLAATASMVALMHKRLAAVLLHFAGGPPHKRLSQLQHCHLGMNSLTRTFGCQTHGSLSIQKFPSFAYQGGSIVISNNHNSNRSQRQRCVSRQAGPTWCWSKYLW